MAGLLSEGNPPRLETTHTTTLACTALTVNPSAAQTFTLSRVGRIVSVAIPTFNAANGIGAAALITLTTVLPAAFRPAAAQNRTLVVRDNNNLVLGTVVVSTAGQMTFGVTAVPNTFANTAALGYEGTTIVYSV